MKFFASLFVAGLVASVAAIPQGSSQATITTTSLTPQQTCLAACALGDVNCEAKCIIVPNPNSLAVNQTNTCVAACDQGDGSEAANAAFGKCEQACIASYYMTVTEIGGGGSGSAATAAPSVSVSITVTGGTTTTLAGGSVSVIGGSTSSATVTAAASSGSGSSGTQGSSSPSASATKGAAANMKVGSGLAGVAGILVAALAL